MPNVDGLQSTRLIREIGTPCPIVALTAFADESNHNECTSLCQSIVAFLLYLPSNKLIDVGIKSGMNSFLAKPLRRPALKAILETYCPSATDSSVKGSSGTNPSSTSNG